ncbi:hypothetical protein SRHO_G00279350 [Serrasalmus rhombeus]
MTTGLKDPQTISDARKTAVINNELLRLKAKDKFYPNLNNVIKNIHNISSSLMTSMPELVETMTLALPAWVPLELARSTRMVSACWSSGLIMAST